MGERAAGFVASSVLRSPSARRARCIKSLVNHPRLEENTGTSILSLEMAVKQVLTME